MFVTLLSSVIRPWTWSLHNNLHSKRFSALRSLVHPPAACWDRSEKAIYCCFRIGQVTSTAQPIKLQLHRGPGDSPEATAAAAKAASAEAVANADSTNASAYGKDASLAVATGDGDLTARVTVASAASLPQVGVMHAGSLYHLFFIIVVMIIITYAC